MIRENLAMPIFRTTRRVEFGDTDMAGIVHFSNFFRYMEAAECEFLRTRGLSVLLNWEGLAIGFPRVSATCEYLAPACFEDLLDIAVTIDCIGTKSVTYAFAFSRAGKPIAHGKVTSVCCRTGADDALEACEIPASYRARLQSDTASA